MTNVVHQGPLKYANPRRFKASTKLSILHRLDTLSVQRTEDNARLRHLLLCRNGLTDEEIEAWRLGYERFGISGLKPRRKQFLQRLAEEARAA